MLNPISPSYVYDFLFCMLEVIDLMVLRSSVGFSILNKWYRATMHKMEELSKIVIIDGTRKKKKQKKVSWIGSGGFVQI